MGVDSSGNVGLASYLACNVQDYGAAGDGVADDTTAIVNAAADAVARSLPLVFGPGTYIYNGTGLDMGANWIVRGTGAQFAAVKLSTGNYLVSSASVFDAIEFSGLTVSGGSGAVRSTGSGASVGRKKTIKDCCFTGYTGAAVSNNASDNPYWTIEGNQFKGANSTSAIGVALSQNSDVSVIARNQFLQNKVHVKLDRSGRVAIRDNDLIQFGAGTQRASIWITANASTDIIDISNNKFGNENQDASDFRIAVTAEGAGTYNGDRLPDFTSSVFAGVHRLNVHHNLVNGITGSGPLIYTRGIGLRGSSIQDNEIMGASPIYLLSYDLPSYTDDPLENVTFYGNYSEDAVTVGPVANCNLGACGYQDDTFEGVVGAPHVISGGGQDGVGYVELLTTRIGSFALTSATKIGNLTDATGATEAAEFSIVNNSEIYAAWAVAPTAEQVFWVECDLAQGSASPVSAIELQVYSGSAASPAYWKRRINVPPTWQRFRFPVTLLGGETSRFKFEGLSTGQIKIGRVRCYHAREPYVTGAARFEQINLAALPTSNVGVPSGFLWRDPALGYAIKTAP